MSKNCTPDNHIPRRQFLKTAVGAAVGIGGAALGLGMASAPRAIAAPPRPQNVITGDQALERLMKGNARYIGGNMIDHNFIPERPALAMGQNPFAGILSCADSRIAPEFAFDTGRGDLFVCRVAGNFANPDTIASFEFGVAVLGLPFILVLGHSACGAVDSTIKAVKDGVKFPGHIPSLVKALRPAVKDTLNEPGDLLVNATKRNVQLTVAKLRKASPILSEAVASGKLKIVGGVYELATGRVDLVA